MKCTFPGCKRDTHANKLCDTHNQQQYRGTALKKIRPIRASLDTARQCIVDHIEDYGWPPTMAEFADCLGIAKGSAGYWLRKLEEAGLIERASSPRAIRIVE